MSKKFENGDCVTWEVSTRSEEWTDRRSDLAQKVFWMCEAKNGTTTDELLQNGASRHKTLRQHVKTDPGPGWQGSSQGGGKFGRLKDKTEESREKSTRCF